MKQRTFQACSLKHSIKKGMFYVQDKSNFLKLGTGVVLPRPTPSNPWLRAWGILSFIQILYLRNQNNVLWYFSSLNLKIFYLAISFSVVRNFTIRGMSIQLKRSKYTTLLKTRRFYIRRNNNKVDSIETGNIVLAYLLLLTAYAKRMYDTLSLINDDKILLSLLNL